MNPSPNTTASSAQGSERERHIPEPGPTGACLICGNASRRYFLHK